MIERFVDYLAFSALLSEAECSEKKYEIVPPIQFYRRGYRDPLGFRIYFGNPNSKKALVVASGQTMENLRAMGKLDAEIIQWSLEIDAQVSRLDLAVTYWVDEDFLELDDVVWWAKNELIDYSQAKYGAKILSKIEVEDAPTTETLYIGDMKKRAKRGIFRAYDKGIELDIGKYMSTRLELEERGENAHNTARRLAESNDIAGNFRSRFNVDSEKFEMLMDADAVDISRGIGKVKREDEDKMKSRWIWLIEQVAPALKEAIEYDRKNGVGGENLSIFLNSSGVTGVMFATAVAYVSKMYDNKDIESEAKNSIFRKD